MKAFFQLIRWPNLLIVLATQSVIWFFVLRPLGDNAGTVAFLNAPRFLLLCLSTICIAAAGYIINDYFDVRIDMINKPDKVIIGRKIGRRQAMLLHSLLNVIGIVIAVGLCYRLGNYLPAVVQLTTTVLLWFYSTGFKRRYMTGNIIVAALTSLTVIVLACYERALIPFYNLHFFIQAPGGAVTPNPFWVLMVYAYFAFMLTWMREIVKDMEDYRGDAQEGCDTMPIRVGLGRSARVVILLGLLALLPLALAAYKLLQSTQPYLGIYVIVFLVLPLIGMMNRLPGRTTQGHYHNMSRWLKVIMVMGILALVVYYYR